jgi:undecaprenyl-diphosphatase
MNKAIFLWINNFSNQNHFLDIFMIFSAKAMPYIFILLEVYLYFISKKKNESIFAFYSVIVSLGLNFIISLFYFHNRPFMDNLGVMLIQHTPENSFPSDHTTFLFAISFSLIFSKIKYSYLLLIFALLGGIARIYTGVHYPFDILGGIFSGLFGAIMVYFFKNKLLKINELIYKIEYYIFKG